MQARRILVTGGTGFLGTRLVRHLHALGHDVHALARRPEVVPSDATAHLWPDDPAPVVATIRPHVLIHLAAHYVRRASEQDQEDLESINVDKAGRVVRAAIAAGVDRIVSASSIHAHGHGGQPANAYGESRRTFEEATTRAARAADVPVAVLILHDVYGPGDPRRKLVPVLHAAATSGDPVGLVKDGAPMDLVHVDDVVQAFSRAALGAALDGAFAVRSGQPVTPDRLHQMLQRALGVPIPTTPVDGTPLARPIALPWDGPDLPGWTPRLDLVHGLATLGPPARSSSD